jgi:carboxyl-terminal processing protease
MRQPSFIAATSLAVVFCLSFVGLHAVAQQPSSPAGELVNQALNLIESHYRGLEKPDFTALRARGMSQLEAACQGVTPCGFEVGGQIVDELTALIGDGHTFRLSPNAYRAYRADASNSTFPMLGLKFDALPDTGSLIVTRVKRESPALRAGIERGDVIWAVNDRALSEFKNTKAALEFIADLELREAPMKLSVSTGKNPRRDFTLEPENLPPWTPVYTLRANGIAFLTFFQFVTPGKIASQVQNLMRAVREAQPTPKAIIVDVRGSGGGSGSEMSGSVQALLDKSNAVFEPLTYATRFETDSRERRRDLREVSWQGKIIVLTNHISRSAAEYLAAGLQESERVTVIGEPTAGVLNSATRVYGLMDGGALAVTANASNRPKQVSPDIVQTDDMATLSRGRDLVLEMALKQLKTP